MASTIQLEIIPFAPGLGFGDGDDNRIFQYTVPTWAIPRIGDSLHFPALDDIRTLIKGDSRVIWDFVVDDVSWCYDETAPQLGLGKPGAFDVSAVSVSLTGVPSAMYGYHLGRDDDGFPVVLEGFGPDEYHTD